MATWPSILVRPLANLTAHEEDNYLAIGLTAELAHALSHYREFRVLEALHRDEASAPRNPDIDFIIQIQCKLTKIYCSFRNNVQIRTANQIAVEAQ